MSNLLHGPNHLVLAKYATPHSAAAKDRQEVRECENCQGKHCHENCQRNQGGKTEEVNPRFWRAAVMIVRLCVTPRLPLTRVTLALPALVVRVTHLAFTSGRDVCVGLCHPPSLLSPGSPSSSTRSLPCGLATSCCYSR